MTEDLKELLRYLIDTRSFTVMDWKLVEALFAPDWSEEERIVIRRIYESNDLDERWMLCHEALGNTAETAELRTWLANKQERK